jgi:hypothetical protein
MWAVMWRGPRDLHLAAPVDPDVLAREAAALATSGRPARTTLEKIAGGAVTAAAPWFVFLVYV